MDESYFNKQVTLIRTIVGAVLALASLLFLWKGISGIGEIGLDFQFFSGKFSTTSAGFALLFAGVILLLPRRLPQDGRTNERRSLGQMAIGILFYIFIGLLPVIGWIGIIIYLHYNSPDDIKNISVLGAYAIMSEVPLFFWVVQQVSKLLQSGTKK